LKDKISAEDNGIISKKVADTQKWLDESVDAETSDYERKQKEIEDLFNPIMSKIYQSAEGGASAGASSNKGTTPSVDEVD